MLVPYKKRLTSGEIIFPFGDKTYVGTYAERLRVFGNYAATIFIYSTSDWLGTDTLFISESVFLKIRETKMEMEM